MMPRALQIAYAGLSGEERDCLSALATRTPLHAHLENIGVGAAALERHRDAVFDAIFIGAVGACGAGPHLAKTLRGVSSDAFLALMIDNIDAAAAAVAINQAQIDRILPRTPSKVALSEVFGALNKRRDAQEMRFARDVLRALGAPAAILDRECGIVFANSPAETLFAQGDPFHITRMGRLACVNAAATERFRDDLHRTLYTHMQRCGSVFMRVDREDGRKPIIAVSVPKNAVVDNFCTYYLIFKDMENMDQPHAEDFAAALNLSAAEGRLVRALALGLNIEQASADSNISVNTGRSYLKSVFDKTGARRQAELVRIALLAVA